MENLHIDGATPLDKHAGSKDAAAEQFSASSAAMRTLLMKVAKPQYWKVLYGVRSTTVGP